MVTRYYTATAHSPVYIQFVSESHRYCWSASKQSRMRTDVPGAGCSTALLVLTTYVDARRMQAVDCACPMRLRLLFSLCGRCRRVDSTPNMWWDERQRPLDGFLLRQPCPCTGCVRPVHGHGWPHMRTAFPSHPASWKATSRRLHETTVTHYPMAVHAMRIMSAIANVVIICIDVCTTTIL
jgi:hypothetical protein